ncbi:unnamed protein product [Coffea canephora]|uniref:RING-type E3 ubiquitin transferase n=1 Tax=Coffea canephora TaxID=49390 RepID=A0A068U2L4_COFCA|nr:unnamed protein product [Coffea canephora]
MARFSLGDEADERERSDPSSSSSRPTPKRQKLTVSPQPQPSQPAVDAPIQTNDLVQVVEGDAEEEEEEESEYEIEAEEEGSEYEDQEEEDDDEDDDDDQEEDDRILQPQPEVNGDGNRDGPISVTLTDPDVLDCPICIEPLSIPVFQCENGHIACSSCCLKIRNKCPSCSWPIGYNRCRAIEKVLESVKVSCRNIKYGCTQMVRYCNKHEHENTCILAPCSCPLLDCNFVGSAWQLYSHFKLRHPASGNTFLLGKPFSISLEKSQRSIILREGDGNIIFILNHFNERHGSAINIVRIAPLGSGTRFSYDLTVRDGDTSIRLQSSVESIRKWVDSAPAKKFLLVPCYYYTSNCGQLELDVCIRAEQSCSRSSGNNMKFLFTRAD